MFIKTFLITKVIHDCDQRFAHIEMWKGVKNKQSYFPHPERAAINSLVTLVIFSHIAESHKRCLILNRMFIDTA